MISCEVVFIEEDRDRFGKKGFLCLFTDFWGKKFRYMYVDVQ